MNKINVDDNFLFTYMNDVENFILEQIPSEKELSHTFSQNFNKKMDSLIKSKNKYLLIKKIKIYSKKIAILAILLVFCITTIDINTNASKISGIILTTWNEFVSIIFHKKDKVTDYVLYPIEATYIPNGYTISEHSINKYEQTIIYCNNAKDEIFYSQSVITQSQTIADTEDKNVLTKNIKNQIISIINNKETYQIYWNDDDYFYTLIGTEDIEELIHMVKSIIEKNKN